MYLLETVPNLIQQLRPYNHSGNILVNNIASLYLHPVKTDELLELARKLHNKHSFGYDEIPTSLAKRSVQVITKVLCHIINNSLKYGIFPERLKLAIVNHIINNSLKYGIFPERLKLAIVKPLYKKGNPKELSSYRPISLLPSFSKLFEVVMRSRILSFVNDHKLLSQSQHGYIEGKSTSTALYEFIEAKSTSTALYEFIEAIIEGLETSKIGISVFLDLSKAYDSLNHELLLTKLQTYGIRGNAYNWLRSYLENRRQKVVISREGVNYESAMVINKHGVPQGSTRRQKVVISREDDISFLTYGLNIEDAALEASVRFTALQDWFSENRLILNKQKTQVLVFKTKNSVEAIIDEIMLGDFKVPINSD
ncbi:Reverse transcriptase (RNA-dependent DNA polymerase) [Popillia japonica]|uniref:Reverse transcriptase (RNA-dependent DNA polymerase) n=1 Tax=Popillia japonica TaxID=7064 RepID=A0AAW1MGP7_POPJA